MILAPRTENSKGRRATRRTQDFGENEDKNHSNVETGLLSSAPDTSISDDSDGEARGEPGKTDGKTSAELDEGGVKRNRLRETIRDQD